MDKKHFIVRSLFIVLLVILVVWYVVRSIHQMDAIHPRLQEPVSPSKVIDRTPWKE